MRCCESTLLFAMVSKKGEIAGIAKCVKKIGWSVMPTPIFPFGSASPLRSAILALSMVPADDTTYFARNVRSSRSGAISNGVPLRQHPTNSAASKSSVTGSSEGKECTCSAI